jgi:hypothetical protein
VWQEQLEQMQDVLTQTKKLTKKDERQVGDLLHQNFPEVTPPPSDHSSISSLDSELTSDTSDDEIHTNQGVGAKSRRIMCRLAKKQRKIAKRKDRRKRKLDAKRERLAFDSREPVSKISDEIMQISKLRYIPIQQAKENEELDFQTGLMKVTPPPKKKLKSPPGTVRYYPARYQSLMYNDKGKTVIGYSLSTTWVAGVFHPRFLELVRNVGIKENTSGVKWSKRRWIPVPVGCAKDDEPPTQIICPTVRCRYLQKDYNTCVFKSMASVFHYAGRKDIASYLSSISHVKGTDSWDARTQLDRLMMAVRTRESIYNKIDFLTKAKAIARIDLFQPDSSPQLWILLGRDGGTNHAVGVLGEYVFDSNVSNALKLTKDTLDWCSNCKEGFTRIHMYVRFRK